MHSRHPFSLFGDDIWSIIGEYIWFDVQIVDDTIQMTLKPCRAFVVHAEGRPPSPCLMQ